MKKTVTLTNIELANAAAALDIFGRRDMAIIPSFKVAQVRKALQGPAQSYQEYREQILRNRALMDGSGRIKTSEAGTVIFNSPEDEAAAKAELTQLNDIEVSVDIQTISLATLGETPAPPNVLEALLWMFDEPAEETPT